MWWDLIRSLTAYFAGNQPIKKIVSTNVKAGIPEMEDIPDYPAIRVCRAGESDVVLWTKGKETVLLYIYCWQGSDSQDPGDAYALIAELEALVVQAIKDWYLTVEDELKIRITNTEIMEIVPDGDVYRPAVGSRITLKITWNK